MAIGTGSSEQRLLTYFCELSGVKVDFKAEGMDEPASGESAAWGVKTHD